MNDVAIIMCPPLSKYPKKPDDVSESEIVNCPDCAEKMWFSVKKKAMKSLCENIGKEIIYCCHDCLKKRVMNEPWLFTNSVKVDI
jgi:hypothetical protein